jgi:hypothetical protein
MIELPDAEPDIPDPDPDWIREELAGITTVTRTDPPNPTAQA